MVNLPGQALCKTKGDQQTEKNGGEPNADNYFLYLTGCLLHAVNRLCLVGNSTGEEGLDYRVGLLNSFLVGKNSSLDGFIGLGHLCKPFGKFSNLAKQTGLNGWGQVECFYAINKNLGIG